MSVYRLLGLALIFLGVSLFVERVWWAGAACLLIGGVMALMRRPRRIRMVETTETEKRFGFHNEEHKEEPSSLHPGGKRGSRPVR
ncbi:hypothetical protein [Geobacillus subterraneus]|uniref:hypothetical protein n=1 Tax=Geobacillus subterraneus TaxID=129338 RepID=UPI0016222181